MKFSKKEISYLILASFTGGSIFFLAQYIAIKMIGPSLPALFVCLLAPIIIAILSLIFFDEKLDKLKVIGFIVAIIGAFLLITGRNISTLTSESPLFIGYIFTLTTPLLWSIFSTLIKNLSKSRENCDLKILK
ncbi:MAG: EamA family transporter [Promethearchaeota archaeon]